MRIKTKEKRAMRHRILAVILMMLIWAQFTLVLKRKGLIPQKCYRTGCSGQICSSNPNIITTCEWRPEYEQYRHANCVWLPSKGCTWIFPNRPNSFSGSSTTFERLYILLGKRFFVIVVVPPVLM